MRIDWAKSERERIEYGKNHLGDTRECYEFLLFPQTISDVTRWLEWARWKEEWIEQPNDYGIAVFKWKTLCWLD